MKTQRALIIEDDRDTARLLALLLASAALLSSCGCVAQSSGPAWYQPSALTAGITAPGLISSPPVTAAGPHGSVRHNGSLSTVGAIVTLTFPLFPVPTKPQGPYSVPVSLVTPTPIPPLANAR